MRMRLRAEGRRMREWVVFIVAQGARQQGYPFFAIVFFGPFCFFFGTQRPLPSFLRFFRRHMRWWAAKAWYAASFRRDFA